MGPNYDGSKSAYKAEIGVIVTLSSSEQLPVISYFLHRRSMRDPQVLCTKTSELRACKHGPVYLSVQSIQVDG